MAIDPFGIYFEKENGESLYHTFRKAFSRMPDARFLFRDLTGQELEFLKEFIWIDKGDDEFKIELKKATVIIDEYELHLWGGAKEHWDRIQAEKVKAYLIPEPERHETRR